MNKNVFWIAPIVVMTIGIFPLPYGYFTLLRLVVCGCALFYTLNFFQQKNIIFLWIFGFIAFLYNPIFPIYLYEKAIWIVVNFITAIIFFMASSKIQIYNE